MSIKDDIDKIEAALRGDEQEVKTFWQKHGGVIFATAFVLAVLALVAVL
jgi:hypothetical protein